MSNMFAVIFCKRLFYSKNNFAFRLVAIVEHNGDIDDTDLFKLTSIFPTILLLFNFAIDKYLGYSVILKVLYFRAFGEF